MASGGIESSGVNFWIRELRFQRKMHLAREQHDSFMISLPKSGRTWHRAMIGYYLARMVKRDIQDAFNLELLCRISGIPRIRYTHNGTAMSAKLPSRSAVVASPIEWTGKNVLLIIRDSRDVLVSSYFHSRFRVGAFDGSISEFVRHPFVGVVKILTALNRWHDNRHLAARFDVIAYEAMKSDPASNLVRSLNFIGIENPNREIVEEAVKFTDFQNLQRLEATNYFQSKAMTNTSGDPRGRKVRSGKVGAYREHLSDEDLAYIDRMEREMGNPFAVPQVRVGTA